MTAHDSVEGVAIIGMAGRFPGARNIDQFWQNLRDGMETISFFSDRELADSGIDPALLKNPDYVKACGTVADSDLFDATFFGYSPREAELLDPQHRLFLECGWEALENAGYDPESYAGPVGIYAGASMNTYFWNNLIPNLDHLESAGRYQAALGNDRDFLTTRLSYKLNLKGPSLDIQTACSTSLVAVQMACQSLLNYQCDMTLAGGVSVAVPPKTGYLYQEGMIFSPDGHCRAFDAQAQGIVGGQGVGLVVLKRLADALADGNHIYAVIKGAAVNNDGALKVGYTAPSVDGQTEVIAMAQALAEVEAETITYVETHGTGTQIGDPIEIKALTQAFRLNTEKKGFCAIGSVKTNIGHLDVAAGVAGLIKTALALQHKLIPPSLHFKTPNPKIDFANSPFYVNATLSEWKTNGAPRRAGVSSFGIGGTNAHVVLEEAPAPRSAALARPWQLMLLSAKTNTALEAATQNLTEHFKQHPDFNLADAAYTLQVGRKAFKHRQMVVCQSLEDAANALETSDPKRVFKTVQEINDRPVVFMFTGQGAQYINMGLDLYQAEPIFREQVNFCAEFLQPHLGLDLRNVLYPPKELAEEADWQLRQTYLTQPALFVIEYALARLWQEWGITPQAMIGHSIGEYVAACSSGVFALKDALTLVAARGRLMQSLPAGAMLTVSLPESQVQTYLDGDLSLAVVNAPNLCVVSGPIEAIDGLEQRLNQLGVMCRRLHTSHAFHSTMMEPILDEFVQQFARMTLKLPQRPFISNVTGTWITEAEATDPRYWARHLRQTVRFADGVRKLLKQPDVILLEVGPGQTLSTLASQQRDRSAASLTLSSLRHPQNTSHDSAFMLNTLGQLWLAGARVDWQGVHTHEQRRRIPLPTYPFERQRYWVEARQQAVGTLRSLAKKTNIDDWFYIPSWKRSITPNPFVLDSLANQELCWLIFSDRCGLGDSVVERLKQAKQDVIIVHVGERFSRVSNSVFIINPQTHDDYDTLLAELRFLGKIPNRIMHLWNVTPNGQGESGLDWVDRVQDLGLYSLLFLAQAIGKQDFTHEIRLEVVSTNLYEVTGTEVLRPEKATLLGPCKIIPEEYPNIDCRSIDIVLSESRAENELALIEHLLAELCEKSSDRICAYRGLYRWVQTFEPVRLNETTITAPRIREGGVYLITGGLGGVGLVLAEYLAKTARAKLILTGRSTFPASEEWDHWLTTHDDQDDVSHKIHKLQELEALGAETLVLSADVAGPEQMQDVIAQAEKRFGQINGVIHAAGVVDYAGIIQRRSRETTETVLAPKVKGTLILDALFSGVQLDFFVLCSTLGTLLPWAKFGEVGYCAANEFLDAFSYYKTLSKNSQFTVTINWTDWQEVGMSVKASQQWAKTRHAPNSHQFELSNGLRSSEGAMVFERILANRFPRVVVSTQDVVYMMIERVGSKLLGLRETSQEAHQRPALSNDYAAPRNELEQQVVDIWQNLLGINPIGIYDNFFEMGGHSLLATQVISRLRETLHVELPLRSLFEASTVAELAKYIETILATFQDLEVVPDVIQDGREGVEL